MLTAQHSVAANTHEACSCNGGRDCTYTACDSYNTWFNLPPGKDRGFVSKQNDVSFGRSVPPWAWN
jgi:hypothetical protein